ncbi:nitroreductase family protein [Kineococcus terrestris]|uniref:nitroreductase family protein n=1 Tax=Kineococcus terrestris TaxID=2044856 RepID=UPI0034DB1865
MELSEVLRRRRMVRRYTGEPVAREQLDRVLAAALRAPSAGGSEGRDLLVLHGADRDAFWELTAPPGPADAWLTGMRTAPVVVLALSDPGAYAARYARADKRADTRPGRGSASWSVDWPDVDTGMAALLVLLAAVDEGLGACLVGVPAHAHEAVRGAFGVPADRRVVAALTIGHPAPASAPAARPGRARRTLADTAHDGRFGVPWDG